jgi:DNA invertase Pin-like site-specific DNA recombinase
MMDAPPSAGPNPKSAVALYLRVSTEDQDLAGQRRELEAEAARQGWTVVAVYEEKVSGTGKVVRTEYERLLKDAARPDRPWTHLLVWSLDRWSREERFSRAVATIEDLEAVGVRFHSLREPNLDSSEDGTPNMGRDLLRAILPVIASFESRRRSERTRVAMREIKAGRRKTKSGKPPGRPRRVTPEKEAKIVKLRKQGLKWREVAPRVGLPAGTCAAVWSMSRKRATWTSKPSPVLRNAG